MTITGGKKAPDRQASGGAGMPGGTGKTPQKLAGKANDIGVRTEFQAYRRKLKAAEKLRASPSSSNGFGGSPTMRARPWRKPVFATAAKEWQSAHILLLVPDVKS